MTTPSPDSVTIEVTEAIDLARRFHEVYERLAPSFGYKTRTETRHFDLGSKNGRLMVAVCAEMRPLLARDLHAEIERLQRLIQIYANEASGARDAYLRY